MNCGSYGQICKMAQQTICVDCIEMGPGCGCYPIEEPTCVPKRHDTKGIEQIIQFDQNSS